MANRMTKVERSWVYYDVGNSAFVLIMVTAIMPIFFKDFAAAGMSDALSTARWGFANSTASLLLAILAPLLGAMADCGRKKSFFLFFFSIGLLFTLALCLVKEGQWLFCLALFVCARVGWAGANIFYDSFIVDVTEPARMDVVSSKGYGWGYIGSVIPFLLVIGLILSAGMADGLPVTIVKSGFLLVVCWWALFSWPFITNVHQRRSVSDQTSLGNGLRLLADTIKSLRKQRQIVLFLAAYFFYIDGVGTIISMSTAYGRDLGFGVTMLILVLLFIQIVAFPFALLYGKLAEQFSTKSMLLVGICVYSVATCIGFLLPSIEGAGLKSAMFWFIAFLVASSMGGIQALSRSYYARLIPAEQSAEYFGFYNVFGKFAAIAGPFLMGIVGQFTGHTRWGVLSLLILFIVGGILLMHVEEE